MTLTEKIQNLFPRAADIPEALLNDIPCVQKGYLVNGEIRVSAGRNAHATMVYQFDASARESRWLLRLSWEYAPLSHVYAILDTDRRVSQTPSLLLKCSHAFSF